MAKRLADLLNAPQDNGWISMAELDAIEQSQRGQAPMIDNTSLANLGPGQGYIQRTGGPRIDMQAQPPSNQDLPLDYANPIDYMGAKGFRLKGDSNRVLLQDGRMVSLSPQADAAKAALRQKQEAADLDMQLKRAQVDNAKAGKWKEIVGDDGSIYRVDLNGGKMEPLAGPSGQPFKKQQKLSATSEKELYEADEMANLAQGAMKSLQAAKLLNEDKDTYSGAGALLRAKIASNLGGSAGADKTIQLDNIIREQAMSSMKAIFGGNPTEGERAILMEIQASSDKTPEQRKALIERGIQLAESRMKWNQSKGNMIRNGGVLGGMPQQPDQPAAPAPKRQIEPGTIRNGYLYMGGDPNDQNSWKAAR